jgi:hypothetical protein
MDSILWQIREFAEIDSTVAASRALLGGGERFDGGRGGHSRRGKEFERVRATRHTLDAAR